MKDGVEYVLRFGETYRGPEDDENSTGDSRYIYAYARVNENLLEQPVLEPVPAPLVQPKADGNASSTSPSTPEAQMEPRAIPVTRVKRENLPFHRLSPPGPPPNFIHHLLLQTWRLLPTYLLKE